MASRMVPLIVLLVSTAACIAAEARLGSLGRNDTVVTREEDPVAIEALADESAARTAKDDALQQSVNVLTDAVDALEARPVADPSLPSRVSAVESVASGAAASASEAADAAEIAKNTADAAKASADAAKATADSAKTTASTAKTTADAAKVTADAAKASATEAVASAANAESVAAGAVATANAAAPATTVSALTDRVVALEERPVTDTTLAARVDAVEASVATVSANVATVSDVADAASADAQTALAAANRADATASAAHAAANTTAQTAQTALERAAAAKASATEAVASAANAESVAAGAVATANAAAPATTVSALTDRVTALESATLPEDVVTSAELAVETSARVSGDADLSASIDSLAAAKADKTAVNTLTSRVDDVASDVSETQVAVANAATAATAAATAAADAHSAANAATDAANLAKTTANAANETANAAKQSADIAMESAATVSSQIGAIYSIAAEAETTANAVSALAQQAATDAARAASAAHNVTNDIKVLYDRDKSLVDAVNGKAETQWFSFANNYADLGWPGTTNYRSEVFIEGYGTSTAYLSVRLGDGLKHVSTTSTTGGLDRRIAVDLDALGMNDTTWVHRRDWALKVYPGEMITTVASSSSTAQNELGQVMSTATVTRTESLSKGVETVWVDESMGSSTAKKVATWTASDGASVNALSNSFVAHVSATAACLCTVSATDSSGVVREVFVPFSVTEKTEETEAYVSDVEGTHRKLANDAMLGYLQSRDTATKTNVGITAEVASDDRAWSWSGNKYVFAGSYMPRSALVFCNLDDEFRPPAVAVAPHYAITAAHWNPGTSRLFDYFPRVSGTTNLNMVGNDGIALAAWARANGYSEEEIQAANISDIFVYRMRENGTTDGPFPDANIPHVLDQSALDYYYNGSLEGISCYTVTQDRYISHAAYSSARGDRWCGFGVDYEPRHVRADIRALLSPSHCSKIYGGDSGRPILFLHNGDTPVLTSIFWTAGSGSSLIGGCEILDAYIQQHSGGTESLKRISAPTE